MNSQHQQIVSPPSHFAFAHSFDDIARWIKAIEIQAAAFVGDHRFEVVGVRRTEHGYSCEVSTDLTWFLLDSIGSRWRTASLDMPQNGHA